MQKWEYKIISTGRHSDSYNQLELNDLGDKGWELVGFKDDQFVFKRPKKAK